MIAIEVGRHAKDFDCAKCLHKNCDQDGLIPGSKGPATYPKWQIDGVLADSRICPKPMITNESREMIRLYTHYKNGLLPMAGGLMDQPASYLEAMEIIENYHG